MSNPKNGTGDWNPHHYTTKSIEPIDVIESWGLPFGLGNVVKYIARWGIKGSPVEDKIKALNYLHRDITGEWLPEVYVDEIREKAINASGIVTKVHKETTFKVYDDPSPDRDYINGGEPARSIPRMASE